MPPWNSLMSCFTSLWNCSEILQRTHTPFFPCVLTHIIYVSITAFTQGLELLICISIFPTNKCTLKLEAFLAPSLVLGAGQSLSTSLMNGWIMMSLRLHKKIKETYLFFLRLLEVHQLKQKDIALQNTLYKLLRFTNFCFSKVKTILKVQKRILSILNSCDVIKLAPWLGKRKRLLQKKLRTQERPLSIYIFLLTCLMFASL